MISLKGTVTFLEFWHAGSGQPGEGDIDESVMRDQDGLPYLPGRSLRGLFQEACCELAAWGAVPSELRPTEDQLLRWFGTGGNQGIRGAGTLGISDAVVAPEFGRYVVSKRMQAGLFEVLSATAIEDSGVARGRSLRRVEVTAPMVLEFEAFWVEGGEPSGFDGAREFLMTAGRLIRRAGKHRNNGLGRCKVDLRS